MIAPSLRPQLTARRVNLALATLTLNLFCINTASLMLGPLLLPIATEFQTSVGAVGQLAAVTSIPWAIAGFFGGPLSDRWGRKPMLVAGNLISGLGSGLCGFTGSYGALLAARLFTGFGASTIGPNSTSATADLVPSARRGAALGWVLSGSSLSSVLGIPLIAYLAGVLGWRVAFGVAGAALIVTGLAEFFVLPVTGRLSGARVSYLSSFRQILSARTVGLTLTTNLLERTCFGLFTVYFPSFLMQTYDLDLRAVAPVLSAIAVGMVVGTHVSGRLTDKFAKRTLALVATLLEGLIVLPLFLFTPGLLVSAAFAFLAGALSASTRPVFMWLLTNVDPKTRGTMMGMTVISNQGGTILGSALGGLVLGFGTYGWLGWFGFGTCLVGALIAFQMSEPAAFEG